MRTRTIVSLAAVLAVAGTAAATEGLDYDPELDEKIVVPSFALADEESFVFTVDLQENGNPVVGFSFSGVVSGISGTATWASDTLLTIGAPEGDSVVIGGFLAENDLDWDFQGSGSTDDGAYASGPHLEDADGLPLFGGGTGKGGTWSFTFTQTFGVTDQSVAWDEVSIVLHKIPAPGALALIGLAGLGGGRRRRGG